MRMNTLAALKDLVGKIGTPGEALLGGFKPEEYKEELGGRSVASVGCEPILHMRGF